MGRSFVGSKTAAGLPASWEAGPKSKLSLDTVPKRPPEVSETHVGHLEEVKVFLACLLPYLFPPLSVR